MVKGHNDFSAVSQAACVNCGQTETLACTGIDTVDTLTFANEYTLI